MPRMGLDKPSIVTAAAQIANEDGLEHVTFARLASALGIKSPSLYNHVENLEALLDALTLRGIQELNELSRTAIMGKVGRSALEAIANIQRSYAKNHPGLYLATLRSVKQHGPETQQAAQSYLEAVLAVLQSYDIEGEVALHAVRCLRAQLQGFIHLELNGGFGMPLDIDHTFYLLLDMLDTGLSSLKK